MTSCSARATTTFGFSPPAINYMAHGDTESLDAVASCLSCPFSSVSPNTPLALQLLGLFVIITIARRVSLKNDERSASAEDSIH